MTEKVRVLHVLIRIYEYSSSQLTLKMLLANLCFQQHSPSAQRIGFDIIALDFCSRVAALTLKNWHILILPSVLECICAGAGIEHYAYVL